MIERILFQNEACVVINKLSGESSEFPEAGRGLLTSREPQTSRGPQASRGGEKFPVPVHRLDVPVSGCLLMAKTPEAAAFLGEAFTRPAAGNGPVKIEKRYWVVVEMSTVVAALPSPGELVHWLYEDRKANKSFATPAIDQAGNKIPPPRRGQVRPKKAVLRYRLIGQGERYLFLEIDLITGRHHQIRSQLAALGLHIKGDLKYGARRSERDGGIRLHAYSLAFPNPLDPNETIRVKALPPAMDSLWMAFAEAVAGDTLDK